MRAIRIGQLVAVEVEGKTVLGHVTGINRLCDPPRYMVSTGRSGPEVVVTHDQIDRSA